MSEIISAVGSLFSAAMTWLQTVAAVIAGGTVGTGESAVTYTAQPLLLVFVILPLVGLGVGLFRRLLNVN